MMALLAGLVAGLTVAYIAYQVIPLPAAYWTGRLEETLGRKETEYLSAWQAVLLGLSGPLRRFAPAQFIEGIAAKLYWAQLQGAWEIWEAGPFLALCVLAGVGGFLAGMVAVGATGGALIGALVGFYLPQVMLGSKSDATLRTFRRQLPEITQLMAMEVATGSSLEQALERVSRGQSLVSAWFRDTLRAARGRLLFSSQEREGPWSTLPSVLGPEDQGSLGQSPPSLGRRTKGTRGSGTVPCTWRPGQVPYGPAPGPVAQGHRVRCPRTEGLLRGRAKASGLKELYALAVQLDAIHRQGTGGKELLSALALSSAAEYLAEVEKQAEALPTKLALPSVLFFFLPFTVAVLLPVGLPLLQSLSGGV